MKYLIVLVVALFGVAQASVDYDRPCRLAEMSPRVKTGFQVAAYLGTWYETSRYEAVNQTDFDCVMARYTANLDGSVQVRNSGYFQNRFIEFVGRADLAFPNQTPLPAKLNVAFVENRKSHQESCTDAQFNVFFRQLEPPAIYWGLSTDYINYAVVWSCSELANSRSREQLWILSRTPELGATQSARVEQIIDQNQFVRSAIRPTNQDLGFCRGGTPV